jgi:hypothetical protein
LVVCSLGHFWIKLWKLSSIRTLWTGSWFCFPWLICHVQFPQWLMGWSQASGRFCSVLSREILWHRLR